eukprot:scaffold23364_cov129-Isochrysis_galbana.AAC.1
MRFEWRSSDSPSLLGLVLGRHRLALESLVEPCSSGSKSICLSHTSLRKTHDEQHQRATEKTRTSQKEDTNAVTPPPLFHLESRTRLRDASGSRQAHHLADRALCVRPCTLREFLRHSGSGARSLRRTPTPSPQAKLEQEVARQAKGSSSKRGVEIRRGGGVGTDQDGAALVNFVIRSWYSRMDSRPDATQTPDASWFSFDSRQSAPREEG